MANKTVGKRVYPADDGNLWLQPGEYGKDPRDGNWYARTPTGLTGNLAAHEVVEHPDGTITVSPSILVDDGRTPKWHGYLKAGVWREC